MRESQVAAAARQRGKSGQEPIPFQRGLGVHAACASGTVFRPRLVVEERRSGPQQPAIPARGGTADNAGIQSNDGCSSETGVHRGEAAPAKANDADASFDVADELRVR